MNSDQPSHFEIGAALFTIIVILMLVGFLFSAAHEHYSESTTRRESIQKQESDWQQTHTSAGRMITVTHDGHQYVITTHGQNGVHVIHSPNCPCLLKAER